MRDILVDDADAAGFEAYCRPYGGSLVGLLAATALLVHEIGGSPVYRTVVPFHTRAKSQWRDSVGWYVGGAPIEVPVARAPDFDSVLAMVRAELRKNPRPVVDAIGPRPAAAGRRLPAHVTGPVSIVSFVDTRGFPGSERWRRCAPTA